MFQQVEEIYTRTLHPFGSLGGKNPYRSKSHQQQVQQQQQLHQQEQQQKQSQMTNQQQSRQYNQYKHKYDLGDVYKSRSGFITPKSEYKSHTNTCARKRL